MGVLENVRLARYTLIGGVGEGHTLLNAFDAALLDAKIGNTNLMKLSSILPPAARYCDRSEMDIPEGSLVPIAFGSISDDTEGQVISAGVAIGISENTYGVIMETSGRVGAKATEQRLAEMVKEAFQIRGLRLVEIKTKVIEHVVERAGCAFAGVVLWS